MTTNYIYSVNDLNTFSNKDLKTLAKKYNIPFIDKNTVCQILAYLILIRRDIAFMKRSRDEPQDDYQRKRYKNEKTSSAGIIPVYFSTNNVLILLGKERYGKKKAEYTGFGGHTEERDTDNVDTASREGYEETMGILGDKNEIMSKINKDTLFIFQNKYYTSFWIQINEKDYIDELFNNFMNYHDKCVEYKKGCFEKERVKFFTLTELCEMVKNNKNKIKFRTISKDFIEEIKELMNEGKIIKEEDKWIIFDPITRSSEQSFSLNI